MRFFKTKIGIALLVLAATLGIVYFVLPRLKKAAPATLPAADPTNKPAETPAPKLAALKSPTVFYHSAN